MFVSGPEPTCSGEPLKTLGPQQAPPTGLLGKVDDSTHASTQVGRVRVQMSSFDQRSYFTSFNLNEFALRAGGFHLQPHIHIVTCNTQFYSVEHAHMHTHTHTHTANAGPFVFVNKDDEKSSSLGVLSSPAQMQVI